MKDLEQRVDEVYQLTDDDLKDPTATTWSKLYQIENTIKGLEMACQDWQDISQFICKKFNVEWMELVEEWEQAKEDKVC